MKCVFHTTNRQINLFISIDFIDQLIQIQCQQDSINSYEYVAPLIRTEVSLIEVCIVEMCARFVYMLPHTVGLGNV